MTIRWLSGGFIYSIFRATGWSPDSYPIDYFFAVVYWWWFGFKGVYLRVGAIGGICHCTKLSFTQCLDDYSRVRLEAVTDLFSNSIVWWNFLMFADFIGDVAMTTGIFLDGTYTGKAAFHMVKQMQTNPQRFRGKKVLFLHTGWYMICHKSQQNLMSVFENVEIFAVS